LRRKAQPAAAPDHCQGQRDPKAQANQAFHCFVPVHPDHPPLARISDEACLPATASSALGESSCEIYEPKKGIGTIQIVGTKMNSFQQNRNFSFSGENASPGSRIKQVQIYCACSGKPKLPRLAWPFRRNPRQQSLNS
jgi:hypothetical protein